MIRCKPQRLLYYSIGVVSSVSRPVPSCPVVSSEVETDEPTIPTDRSSSLPTTPNIMHHTINNLHGEPAFAMSWRCNPVRQQDSLELKCTRDGPSRPTIEVGVKPNPTRHTQPSLGWNANRQHNTNLGPHKFQTTNIFHGLKLGFISSWLFSWWSGSSGGPSTTVKESESE